jgi:DNA-binding FrmR family transcriptional regulator
MSPRSLPALAACGCGAPEAADPASGDRAGARRATAVDPAIKKRNLARLRRIEGQVRGLQKMVEEERWCADVLTQVSSVQEALRSVSKELLRNHLRHCTTAAVQAGEAEAEAVTDELVELMFRYAR